MQCFDKILCFPFFFRPSGLNLLVENTSIQPISRRAGFAHPLFFQASGMNRLVENVPPKNINLGEVAHLPLCIVPTGWQGCAMPDSVCGDAFLQIVARLRHAVVCQDRGLFRHGVRMRAKDFSPSLFLSPFHENKVNANPDREILARGTDGCGFVGRWIE